MTSEVSIIYRLIIPLFKVFKNIFWLAYKLVGFHVACSYISLISLFHEFYLLFHLPLPSLFKHCHPQYSLPLFPYHICTIFLAFLKTSFLSHNDFFLASRSLQEFQDKQSKKCKSVPLRKGIRCLTFWGWVTSFSIIFFISIHFPTNSVFLHNWIKASYMHVLHFIAYWSVGGYVDWFHLLEIVNRAAMNIDRCDSISIVEYRVLCVCV